MLSNNNNNKETDLKPERIWTEKELSNLEPIDFIDSEDVNGLRQWFGLGWDFENPRRLLWLANALKKPEPQGTLFFKTICEKIRKRDDFHGYKKGDGKALDLMEPLRYPGEPGPVTLLSMSVATDSIWGIELLNPKNPSDFYHNVSFLTGYANAPIEYGLILEAIGKPDTNVLKLLIKKGMPLDFSKTWSPNSSNSSLKINLAQFLFSFSPFPFSDIDVLCGEGMNLKAENQPSGVHPILRSLFKDDGVSILNWYLKSGGSLNDDLLDFSNPSFPYKSFNQLAHAQRIHCPSKISNLPDSLFEKTKTAGQWFILVALMDDSADFINNLLNKNMSVDITWLQEVRIGLDKISPLSSTQNETFDCFERLVLNQKLPMAKAPIVSRRI